MIKSIDNVDIRGRIDLPDGGCVILLDRLGKSDKVTKKDVSRNVFRLDANGHVIWQIFSQFDADGDPFTQIHMENGLSAYRWDGGTYSVDLDTGAATPLLLER